MASIYNLGYSTALGPVVSKGLVLGNKEGFFRDLGANIFNNNDYVRIAVAMSFNFLTNPNSITNNYGEAVTNNTVSDGFYFGFKSPNSSMPNIGQDPAVKFAGYWCPPKAYSGNYFCGYSQIFSNYGAMNGTSIYGAACQFGSLTQPRDWSAVISNTNPSAITSPRFNGLSSQYVSYLGIELNSNGIIKGKNYITNSYEIEGNSEGASFNAMKNFINNTVFNLHTTTLTGSHYGNATAIFLYNPLNTVCIRVHGMIAAGFKY